MQAEKNTVVSFHYALKGENGEAIENSRDAGTPVEVLIGHNALIAGLEKALIGHAAGDQVQAVVEPAEGYGERREGNIQRVPKKYFKDGARLRPGMTTNLSMKEGGMRTVVVSKVGSSVIDVDLNHPLAGRVLNFDVEIISVREAAEEEIAHGHVHGPGAHA
jgi:FKBP-type peptidyl-prolyl cis-trans isomerase SlyD